MRTCPTSAISNDRWRRGSKLGPQPGASEEYDTPTLRTVDGMAKVGPFHAAWISQANYTGISVGFGWTTAANAMQTNKINYNDVHHITNILADGAAIYTLSNQSPDSEMQYNYVHDFSQSQWADYQIGGLYLDEGTTGYTVAHNVFVNAPTSIFQNKTGANTLTDNGGSSPATISAACIEAGYADIKSMALPPFD